MPLIRLVFEEISLSKTPLVRQEFPNQGQDHHKFALMKTIKMRLLVKIKAIEIDYTICEPISSSKTLCCAIKFNK